MQSEIIQERASLFLRHGPRFPATDVPEQLGSKETVHGKEIEVTLVSINGPDRAGVS